MESPCTPQSQGRARALQDDPEVLQEHPISAVTEQLQRTTISRPTAAERKRDQTAPTPASQARPRTQRRTTSDDTAADEQENIPVGDEQQQQQHQSVQAPASSPHAGAFAGSQQGCTPSRLSCITALRDELSCGICLEICVRPCATPCGHNFCRSCLRQALQHKRQCPHCREVVPPPNRWQPKVNTALWNTIQLLFPQHAAEAPPPTPPDQQPPAAAAASSRQPGLARPAGPTRGQAARGPSSLLSADQAEGGGMQTRGRTHNMAHALAASRGSWMDAAAMQPFRPPRNNNNSSSSSSSSGRAAGVRGQAPPHRQPPAQTPMPPVLEPELVNMLRGMPPGPQAASQGHLGLQLYGQQLYGQQSMLAPPLRPRGHLASLMLYQQGMHLGMATLQQQHTTTSGQQNGRVDVVNLLDDDDVLAALEISSPGTSPPQPGSSPSSRRLAGHASALPRRTGQSAAAAAAVPSVAAASGATGDTHAAGVADEDDDLLLMEALLLSSSSQPAAGAGHNGAQHPDNPTAARTGTGVAPAAAATATNRPAQQQQQQQGASSGLDTVLFGRIHSGSSPVQFWADPGVPQEPDWLLLDSNAATGGQQRQQPQSDAGRPARQPQSRTTSSSNNTNLVPVCGATGRVLSHRWGPAAAAGPDIDDVAVLLDDLEDEDGPSAAAAGRTRRREATLGSSLSAELGASGMGARQQQRHRQRARVILDVSDEDSGSDSGPHRQHTAVHDRAGATGSSGTGQAAAPQAGSVAVVVNGGSSQAAGRTTSTHPRTSSDDEGHASNAAWSAPRQLQQQAASGAAGPQQPPAAAAAASAAQDADGWDVLALTLANSPEPQPLLSRLARISDRNPAQQQPSRDPQQSHAADGSSSQPLQHADGIDAGHQQLAEQGSQQQDGDAGSDEDDFQPRATAQRLTAARAHVTLASVASGRRMVPGLRPTSGRRTTRSRNAAA